jgi:hypothetical protein
VVGYLTPRGVLISEKASNLAQIYFYLKFGNFILPWNGIVGFFEVILEQSVRNAIIT